MTYLVSKMFSHIYIFHSVIFFSLVQPTTSSPTTLNPTTANPTSSQPTAQVPVVLQCGTSHSDDTSNYSPVVMPLCGTATGNGGARWYEITGATAGQTVTLTTCGQASYDTKISVWDDKSDSNTCIAGNDDDDACSLQSTVTYTSDGTPDDALVQ